MSDFPLALADDLRVLTPSPLSRYRLVRINQHPIETLTDVQTAWRARDCKNTKTRCIFARAVKPPTLDPDTAAHVLDADPAVEAAEAVPQPAGTTPTHVDAEGPSEERPIVVSFQTTGNVLTGSDHRNLIRAGLNQLVSTNTKVYVSTVQYDKPVSEYQNPLLYYAFAPSGWTLARGGPEVPVVDPSLDDADQDERVRCGAARYSHVSFNQTVRRSLESTSRAFAEHAFWNFGVLNVALRRNINQNARFVLKHSPHHHHTIAEVIKAFELNESDPNTHRHNTVIGMLHHAVDVICRTIPGTPAHRAGFRTHIVGTVATFNSAFLWITFSPATVHSIECTKLAGRGLQINLDVPCTFPSVSGRTQRTVGNPVATARFYERMLRHYFDAFINWPWDKTCARGPGLFGWPKAYNATTEMQRGGMLHLHMLMHCMINMHLLPQWLADPVNQQAFFAHLDSLQDSQLPEAMHFSSKNEHGYPHMTQNERTGYTVRVGECTDRVQRDAADGHAVYATTREAMTENHGCYPPARPQHHFYYPSDAQPLCINPDKICWVGVLGSEAGDDQIGELVQDPNTGDLQVKICTLDISATGGRTLPITDRIVRFDHIAYKRELIERSVLAAAAVRIHNCHPLPPKATLGCFTKSINQCKSGAPWYVCCLGERWLLAEIAQVTELRSNMKEVPDERTIPDNTPFEDWVEISTVPLTTLEPRGTLEIDTTTTMRFDVQARPREVGASDMPGWTIADIAALWYNSSAPPRKMAPILPIPKSTTDKGTIDQTLIDLEQEARTSEVKLYFVDVLKLKHKTYTLHESSVYNSAWPCAIVFHVGTRFWPLTAIRDNRLMDHPPATLFKIASTAEASTWDQAVRAARAFSTYLYASNLDARQIRLAGLLHQTQHAQSLPTSATPSSSSTKYVFYDGDQHAVSVNSLASTLEGFNQCVRVLAGRGLDQVLTMYMTVYMTKTGFSETKINELYLAALQRLAMYDTTEHTTNLDFYANRQ